MRALGLAAVVLAALAGLAPNAGASTLPGRNGAVAAISHSRRIGIVTPARRLRIVHSTHLREEFILDLSFSPDGRRIAFAEASAGLPSFLSLLDLRTGDVKGIGTHDIGVSHVSYLSDGHIVFSGTRRGNRPPRGTFEISGGGHLHRLFGAQEVAVSADGRWFVSTNAGNSYLSLFLLDAHGRRAGRITPAPDPTFHYRNPTFSPDGRWIAYQRDIERHGGSVRLSDVFVVRRDGTHRRRLTHGGGSAEPVFSPDGRWLAFIQSHAGSGGNIAVVLVRHPNRRKTLTRIPRAGLQSPIWGSGAR